MKDYFAMNKKRNIEPPVCTFPWREYTNDVFENAWILSHSDKVKLDGQEVDISKD